MFSVTKQFAFCYGHRLCWGGPCGNQHGHNAILEVEFSVDMGEDIIPQKSKEATEDQHMVVDFYKIKELVAPIVDKLDHKNLNEELPEIFQPPTAENIIRFVLDELDKMNMKVRGINTKKSSFDLYKGIPHITRIRLYETPTSWAEWRRDYDPED